MVGGARPVTVHKPETCILNDEEDKQIDGVPEYLKSWPGRDIKDLALSSADRTIKEGLGLEVSQHSLGRFKCRLANHDSSNF
jgi:hypothetical protein